MARRSSAGRQLAKDLGHYQTMAEGRITAACLAIRLYKLEHGGRAPATLQALAPEYLPAVPADPYRADGGAISYDSTMHLLYSVGKDGVDNRGTDLVSRGVSLDWNNSSDCGCELKP